MLTRNNRSSAINVSSPWRGMLPNPDGTVGQPDRQHVAYMYAGISAGGGAAPSVVARHRGFTLNVARLLRSSR